MNKKGFTIVELLAVMTILSLLIIIIVSGTSGAKTRAVEKAKNIEKKKIIDAAISYYESNTDTYDSLISSGSHSCKVSVEKLRSSKIYDTNKFVNENINDNTLIKVTNNNGDVSASILSADDASISNCSDIPASNYIHNLIDDKDDPSSPEVIDAGEGSDCTYTLAYDRTVDNNLRYIGANPCNYVSFNNELWRIVGIMNNVDDGTGNLETRVKLVRKDSIGEYSWDTSDSSINKGWGINDWSQADLKNELNGDYLNGDLSTDTNWYYGISNKQTTFDHTKRLKSDAQNLIKNVKWPLGGFLGSVSNQIPKNMYTLERKTETHSTNHTCSDGACPRATSWIGKVALLSPSDYGYATAGGGAISKVKCTDVLSTNDVQNDAIWYDFNNPSYNDCADNNWVLSTGWIWLLNPNNSSPNRNFIAASTGIIHNTDSYYVQDVRPAVYLKSGVRISGGNGSQDNPYTLG